MAKWKVTVYLTDKCQEHDTEEGCATPPYWWPEDGRAVEDFEPGEYCWRAVPKGELDTEQDARSWMDVLFTYGDKHQEARFTQRSIERVEDE